ncbi:DUF4249 domain-containing protein [Flammeovirga sp. MY04]|uniref:DUF4249 domain-containing protein n=1 Tax=Flammeovirga sp. MY04 TaxID=1191459 RepID=UPI0008063D57|nr:DUF4249 domain-containing protein [Flammeovirga sp. MY04]ANQ51704.1 DUF4249 domain-containing protein [Flammeovirga sp. MY04]
MKTIKIVFTLIVLAFIVTACEKVIDVDLNDAEPRIVIEAVIWEGEHDMVVKVSKTAPYFDNSPSEKISNASIKLKYDDTAQDVPNTGEGEYHFALNAKAGTTYNLEVMVEGETYTASTSMLDKIAIDSAYSVYEEGFGPIEAGYKVYLKYQDPANVPNYYRLMYDLNGQFQNEAGDLRVYNDIRNDGLEVELGLLTKSFEVGDTLDLTFIHFDEPSYDYFSTLGDIIGGGGPGPSGGSAAPGNPLSNWSNNALGYFSAYNYDTARVVVIE